MSKYDSFPMEPFERTAIYDFYATNITSILSEQEAIDYVNYLYTQDFDDIFTVVDYEKLIYIESMNIDNIKFQNKLNFIKKQIANVYMRKQKLFKKLL